MRYNNYHETKKEKSNRLAHLNYQSVKIDDLQEEMKPYYADFKQLADNDFPELAGKGYGFSVDAKGSLVILDNKDNLSEKEQDALNDLLNSFKGSSVLTLLANEYVESTVKWVELDRRPDGTGMLYGSIGNFDVRKDNFHEIVDLTLIFKKNDYGFSDPRDSLGSQIYNKAEMTNNRADVDEYVNGEWINVQV